MGGDDAVCFSRLRIEDDAHDDVNSRCNEDHHRHRAERDSIADNRCTCTDVDVDGKLEVGEGEDTTDNDDADSPTEKTPMQHDDSSGTDIGGAMNSHSLSSSSLSTTSKASTNAPTLLCDAWYGFPTQKRPRRERINAVSRQISNFLEWGHRHTQHKLPLQQQSTSSSTKVGDVALHGDRAILQIPCHVAFLGAMGDVRAVQHRVDELSRQGQLLSTLSNDTNRHSDVCNNDWENERTGQAAGGDAILFQSDVTIQAYLESFVLDRRRRIKQQPQTNDGVDITSNGASTIEDSANINNNTGNETDNDVDTAIYLSPDTSYTLPITCRPPHIVILGMLVDRQTVVNRSQQRAENILGMKAAQLPLQELNVSGLHSNEPLNVDTVLELMQRWWWNCDEFEVKLQQQQQQEQQQQCSVNDDKVIDDAYRKCFLDAAAWALKSHRDRHPNRTLHS